MTKNILCTGGNQFHINSNNNNNMLNLFNNISNEYKQMQSLNSEDEKLQFILTSRCNVPKYTNNLNKYVPPQINMQFDHGNMLMFQQ